jgi:hypothetical protein
MPDIHEVYRSAASLEPAERLRLIARLWASMPEDHWAAPTAKERAEIQRRIDQRDFDAVADASWRIAERMRARFDEPGPQVYSAPRRFDLATIFVVTSAYALLLGGFSAMDASPIVSFVIGGFVVAVGIGQAVLFGGEKPRAASVLVGIVMHAIFWIGFWIYYPRVYPSEAILFVVGFIVVGGAILGYCSGALVGGVFLVADKIRSRFGRSARPEPPIDQDAAELG